MYLLILTWLFAAASQGYGYPAVANSNLSNTQSNIAPPVAPQTVVTPSKVPDTANTLVQQTSAAPQLEEKHPLVPQANSSVMENKAAPKVSAVTTQKPITSEKPIAQNPKIALPKAPTVESMKPGARKVTPSPTITTTTAFQIPANSADQLIVEEKISDPQIMSKQPVDTDGVYFVNSEKHGVMKDDASSHFFAYLLTFMVLVILCYLIFHNKQKILALLLEGRNEGSRRQRGRAKYHKLDNNLEEAMSSTKGGTSLVY